MHSKLLPALTISALALSCVSPSTADAAGVTVGSSSLIQALDYSDTFTGTDRGGRPDRPFMAAIQPAGAYVVENSYGNPSTSFQSAAFSFASDDVAFGQPGLSNGSPAYPGGTNASGAGSDTGFTQSGGNVDYGLPYGLRDEYVVQVDAVQSGDRIDISSGTQPGIFNPQSLSVFFRGDGSGNASLYNGTTDTALGINTGITGQGIWYNYAVRYDRLDNEVELFVDQTSVALVDLTTFAGGIYSGFSNAFVGAGGGLAAGNNRIWTDNFQVGTSVPEPGTAVLTLGALALAGLRRRRS